MADERLPDPPFAGAFVLTVDDLEIGTFAEVSGLSVEIAVEELVEGGNNGFTHKLPGGRKYTNITLKRGVTDNDSLLQWLQECSGEGFEDANNIVRRRDASLSVLDPQHNPVRTWVIAGAMPVRWNGPQFAASSSDLATEELEVTHCGFRTG